MFEQPECGSPGPYGKVSTGQRMLMESFTALCDKADTPAAAIILRHNTDVEEQVPAAECYVEAIRFRNPETGTWHWFGMAKRTTVKELVDVLLTIWGFAGWAQLDS